jgi:hypothetical protein
MAASSMPDNLSHNIKRLWRMGDVLAGPDVPPSRQKLPPLGTLYDRTTSRRLRLVSGKRGML